MYSTYCIYITVSISTTKKINKDNVRTAYISLSVLVLNYRCEW